jgi:hypothetical protein
MFESVADAELIDVMGEATRDESTAIAQRLLAVGELYARRAAEHAECQWWSVDAPVWRRIRGIGRRRKRSSSSGGGI